ncbi:calcium-binding protein 39-like [Elysia marginata]|uniref:Calcium-binding protein 39-like n=1 Tax=Elysia marginata TaxID=1093978 RepID=A0AAV4FD33_9GAST|nr:calcium-binding protein 39-like [Elysia marginata]
MPLFSSKSKTPHEALRYLRDTIPSLKNSKDKEHKKISDEVTKTLHVLKTQLYGSQEQEGNDLGAQISSEILSSLSLFVLIDNLAYIDFEGRKDVVAIVNNVVRREIGVRNPGVENVYSKPELIFLLIKGYENQEIALNCGMMLREFARNPLLATTIIGDERFYKFFEYVEVSTFDIASDAFSTFKLLGELLLDRYNFTVMNRYISQPENLKLMMNLLREKSKNIQFEAFHVFKIFVANPNKPKPIMDILLRNRERLVEFLTKFHTERSEDEQFNDEKSYLIKQIKELRPAEENYQIKEENMS